MAQLKRCLIFRPPILCIHWLLLCAMLCHAMLCATPCTVVSIACCVMLCNVLCFVLPCLTVDSCSATLITRLSAKYQSGGANWLEKVQCAAVLPSGCSCPLACYMLLFFQCCCALSSLHYQPTSVCYIQPTMQCAGCCCRSCVL